MPVTDLGYSHVAVSPPGERIATLAGQSGHDAGGTLPETFESQLSQALRNVARAVTYIGCSTEDVMRLQIFVADCDSAKLAVTSRQLKAVWPGCRPAMTLVPVPRLALDGMLVVVEATATVPS